MPQQRNGPGFSFAGMVVSIMVLLKLKEKFDEYQEVPNGDERAGLTSDDTLENRHGDGPIALVDSEAPFTHSIRPKKKKACCLCCGVDCSLLFKAIGIVIGLYTLYYGFKAVRWATSASPTGLEGMPAFGESLGCPNARFTWTPKTMNVSAPMGDLEKDHRFDVRGDGLGTIIIADGDSNSDEIKYELTIKATKLDILSDVKVIKPTVDSDGILKSLLRLQTPLGADTESCMRYDVKIYVPPQLKKLQIEVHTPVHVRFDSDAKVKLDNLYVTLYSPSETNMILPHRGIRAKKVALEVYRGWIVGDAPIVEETSISTQRGNGTANVKFYPTLPEDTSNVKAAVLDTTTGYGRSDFVYIADSGFKRQITSKHLSSGNGDLYLTYKQAHFDGKLKLQMQSYRTTGLTPYNGHGDWTHFVGSAEGDDQIEVNSRGWTGLYF